MPPRWLWLREPEWMRCNKSLETARDRDERAIVRLLFRFALKGDVFTIEIDKMTL